MVLLEAKSLSVSSASLRRSQSADVSFKTFDISDSFDMMFEDDVSELVLRLVLGL